MTMPTNEADAALTRVLVRRPGPALAAGEVTHIERVPIDLDLAFAQWADYVAALTRHGWTTVEVSPADSCPDAVFVEDTVVIYRDLAIIARPGAPSRRAETAATENLLSTLGYRIARIEAPATLDGGDVLKHRDRVWVGIGGRTNHAGADQLKKLLAPEGVGVVEVPVTRALHLKSVVTALPDGTVIGYPPLVEDPSVWPRFLGVPEEPGAHVVVLDDSTVLLARSAPATADLLANRGLAIVDVDISEFEKLEGCVTCLSVRLRPQRADDRGQALRSTGGFNPPARPPDP